MDTAGTYIIALRLHKERTIAVGRLGRFRFPSGWYLYAGSAFGPGGLRARLDRHRRRLDGSDPQSLRPSHDHGRLRAKRAHWHVDHLREAADWVGAWASDSMQRSECDWAAALRSLPQAAVVAPGFGASDCRCEGHLVWLPELPADSWFATSLGAEKA